MNYARRNAGVITINGFLFVIGGDDGTSNLASVEVIGQLSDRVLETFKNPNLKQNWWTPNMVSK